MVRSYALCTEGAKRCARGCSGTRRWCNCTQYTRLATDLKPGYISQIHMHINQLKLALGIIDWIWYHLEWFWFFSWNFHYLYECVVQRYIIRRDTLSSGVVDINITYFCPTKTRFLLSEHSCTAALLKREVCGTEHGANGHEERQVTTDTFPIV